MDEDKSLGTEVTEQEFDAFEDGWDDETTLPRESGETGATEAEETGEEGGVDQTGGNPEENAEPENASEAGGEAENKAVDQRFTLKHLGEVKEVGTEEMTALAQKGLDYDRQKGDYEAFQKRVNDIGGIDALRERSAFLEELAAASNVTIEELIDSTRAGILAKKEGIDIKTARERVNLQKRERALEAREQKTAEKEKTDEAAEKRQADIADFIKAHPNVKADEIPEEVWRAVGQGDTLTNAYTQFELKRLREENEKLKARAETAEKNAENRKKSAGSVQSAGAKNTKTDPFDEAWNEDF